MKEAARLGTATPRVEGREKVTGAARYAAEQAIVGMHHAVIVSASMAAGRIVDVEAQEALSLAGVIGVLDHRSAPRLTPVDIFPRGPAGERRMPLQDDRVAYAGQAVALVVATSAEIAAYAASLVRVTFAPDVALTMDGRLREGHTGEVPPEPLRQQNDATRGDVAAGLAAADVRLEATFDTPAHAHNALELGATVAIWDEEAGTLVVHDSTQWVLGARRTLADALGLALDRVRVLCPYTGGGFGSKCFTWSHTILAAVAARQFRKPVRLVLSRAQTLTAFGCRPQARQTVTLGASRDGKLTAIRHHALAQTSVMDTFLRGAGEVSEVLYACPHLETRNRSLAVHSTTPTNMRTPAESFGSFALECAMDELAETLHIDPLELHRKNLPRTHPDGLPWSSCGLGACYDAGAAAFGWSQRPLAPRSMRKNETLLGWGMAAAAYGAYRSQAAVRVTLRSNGSAEIACATHEIGSGTQTLLALIAADALGLPMERVTVHLGDTDLPAAPVHGASRTAASVGPAVQAVARRLRERVLALGNSDDPGSDLCALLAQAGVPEFSEEGRAGPPELDDAAFATLASGHNTIRQPKTKTVAMYAFGAHFVEVQVRPSVGEVKVTRVVSRFAAGRILNPLGAHSQVLGGVVFGLGMALHEAIVWDERWGVIGHSVPRDLRPEDRAPETS